MVSRQRMSMGTFLSFEETAYSTMHRGNAGDHGREQKHHGHQRRGPPRIGLHRAEDEAHVSVQQKRRRDADDRDRITHLVVDAARLGADVIRSQRQRPVNEPRPTGGGLRQPHDFGAILQPDFEQQHHREIPQVNEAEHGHGRGACAASDTSQTTAPDGPGEAARAAAPPAEKPAPSAAPAGKWAAPHPL